MARDMTAEGQPISKPKEPIWNKRMSRRALLGGAAAAGAGLAALAVLGIRKEESQSKAVQTEATGIEIKDNLFSSIRERLNALNNPDKENLLGAVDKLESTDHSINAFMTLYENQKEPDGTPTLLALEMQQLAEVDLSSYYPNMSASDARKAKAESEIFFLMDRKRLDGVKNVLKGELIDGSDNGFVNALKTAQIQYEQGTFFSYVDYSQINSRSRTEGKSDVSVEVGLSSSKIGAVRSAAEAFLAIAPKIGDRQILIRRESGGEFNAAKQQMEVGVDQEQIEQIVAHEFGHYLAEENLRSLSRDLSEGEIFEAMMMKRRLMSQFLRPPSAERIFGDDKKQAYIKFSRGDKLTEDEFQAFAAIDIDERWIVEADFCDTQAGAQEFVYASYESRRDLNYQTFPEFVRDHEEKLTQISEKNLLAKDLIADFRRKPEIFDKLFFTYNPDYKGPYSERTWWEAMRNLARVYYLEKVFKGDVEVSKDDLQKAIRHKKYIVNEYMANSLGLAIIYKEKIINQPRTIVGSYLATFS